ncbi:MAG: hypothetical protein QNJ84_16200 [Alphaproteobacteria bacterium]|nr:hypothetical protein [Alphaproteobacteria bacterium]
MVESVSRNQGGIVLAASLGRIARPEGFFQLGSNEQKTLPGFSTATADLLFQPIVNVVDAENALLEQRIFDRLQDDQPRVDARSVQNRLRNRDLIENEYLRRSPDQVLEDLRLRYGISADGPRTDFASVFDRPDLADLFPDGTAGLTLDPGLTQLNTNRVIVGPDETYDLSNLQISPSAITPDAVLVRLDNSAGASVDSDTGETTLGPPVGKLLLNGVELAGNQEYQLTLAEYEQLEYQSDEFNGLDYFSVVGLDTANGLRGGLVTSAITTNNIGVERFTRDGLERFEFIGLTEAEVTIPRLTVSFEGTFVNGDALADINAGVFEVTVNQFGNLDNVGTNLLQQSTGNELDVTFGSSSPVDGVVVNVKVFDDAVDITRINIELT